MRLPGKQTWETCEHGPDRLLLRFDNASERISRMKHTLVASVLLVLTACGQWTAPISKQNNAVNRQPAMTAQTTDLSLAQPTIALEPPALTEWRNFVQVGGVLYLATDVGGVATEEELGPVFATTTIQLDPNLPALPYHPKDGDALLLAPGTPVYSLTGWKPEFLLAAHLNADLIVFQAINLNIRHGRDMLDLTADVRAIGINTSRDRPKYEVELARISDAREVERLTGLVMDAPVARDTGEHTGNRYTISFVLANGSTINCTYWVESREVCRGLEMPSEVQAAVKRSLPDVTPTRAVADATYQGIVLPPPIYGKVSNGTTQLPPAWLIVDGTAVLATYGSYTVSFDTGGGFYQSEHGDAVAPEMHTDFATASLAANEPVIIVVDTDAVSEFHARVAPWPRAPYDPATPNLQTEQQSETGRTVYRIEVPPSTDDQVLLIAIAFRTVDFWGDVTYLWRLRPAKP
jgi:hypothetical protein